MAYGIVVGGSLNRRASASSSATALGQYADGAYISITNYNSSWYKTTFTYNNVTTTGYVMKAYVVVVGDYVKTRKSSINVRASASASASRLYTINSGVSAEVIAISNNTSDGYGWIKANYGSGVGWVRGDMFNKTVSGDSSDTGGNEETGSTSTTYNALIVDGGAYAYSQMNANADVVTVTGWVTVIDNGVNEWFTYRNNGVTRYILRKNVNVSYDNSKTPNTMFGSSLLQLNSSGRYVMHLHHYLNRYLKSCHYATIAVDGSFGATTKQKVVAFQQERGLSADGVVGDATKREFITFVNELG